jgi:hypothetical protein
MNGTVPASPGGGATITLPMYLALAMQSSRQSRTTTAPPGFGTSRLHRAKSPLVARHGTVMRPGAIMLPFWLWQELQSPEDCAMSISRSRP